MKTLFASMPHHRLVQLLLALILAIVLVLVIVILLLEYTEWSVMQSLIKERKVTSIKLPVRLQIIYVSAVVYLVALTKCLKALQTCIILCLM
jgi:hypothetical protein